MFSDNETDSGGGEGSHQWTINEHYAKAYAYRKEREELVRLEDKYGSDANEDEEGSSEDDGTEDEDGEDLTPAMDVAILKTLAKIKAKDPSIYDKGSNVFEEEQKKVKGPKAVHGPKLKKDKSKPVLLHQQLRESLLNPTSRSPTPEPEPSTYVQEQKALRDETAKAFHGAVADDDDEFLVPREKTKDEIDMEDEEYREFLQKEVGDLKNVVEVDEEMDLDGGEYEVETMTQKKADARDRERKKKKQKQKDSDQQFLVNYILNRGWIDRSSRHVPTYSEVTKSKDDNESEAQASGNGAGTSTVDMDELEDEGDFEEVAETFETSYNMRFEEPNSSTIQTYPRTIISLARRKDSTRKEARERKAARVEEKKSLKREEIKRMKALKMKELRRKLERIGNAGGLGGDEDPAELDLDAEWDSEAHEKQMAELFHDDEGDADGEADVEKPTWDDDIDIDDILPQTSKKDKGKKKKKKKDKMGDGEEAAGVDVDAMDADAGLVGTDAGGEEEWDGTEEMRKRKLDEYMEELYSMEFNDMVGDMPTRFKYLPVERENYGLSAAEVLVADDKELNQYMSVKKIAPYRSKVWDRGRGERLKDFKNGFKKKWGEHAPEGAFGEKERQSRKRKGRKERQKEKEGAAVPQSAEN